MAAITRTSPLDLREVKKTQRRVAALLNAPESCICSGRRKRTPAGFCYVCSQLDPRGRGEKGNPYRHLLAKGLLKACPHLPPAPHPTFVSSRGEQDDDDDEEDDGFDEESLDFGEGGSQDGGMFDTTIVREEGQDPRLFTLPPVFGGSKDGQRPEKERKKGKSKHGRLVPMVSEKTFLTTNKRGQGRDPDADGTAADGKVAAGAPGRGRKPGGGGDLRLPRLGDQRASLVAEGRGHGEGQGQGRRKEKDPRRLHSERIDRRPENGGDHDRITRSDSAIGLERTDTELTREKTDPPPQPIVVSIKDQDGAVLQKLPVGSLPPGLGVPTEAFADNEQQQQQQHKARKKRARKQRRDEDPNRYGSASPAFSGSISISRETTLSGYESPDFQFMSRLRSASWCECPEHSSGRAASSGSCPECRKSHGQHEKWCVSRNSLCQRCGKAFKRKYPHPERKTSFGTIRADSGATRTGAGGFVSAHSPAGSTSGQTRGSHHRRHQNCSPTKTLAEALLQQQHRVAGDPNRVRFQEDGSVVYPQRETFPDSEDGNDGKKGSAQGAGDDGDRPEKTRTIGRSHFRTAFDADIHRRAYDLALADAKTKQLLQPAKKKKQPSKDGALDAPRGVYFSYFPRLKKRKPEALPSSSGGGGGGGGGDGGSSGGGEGGRATSPKTIGIRSDSREGKRLKVKKGLKHVLGSTKLEDYYPGGKCYPR